MRTCHPQNRRRRDALAVSFALLLVPATAVANGYPQMWRIETSMSLTQVPRPPLELSMNPTLRRPPRPSPWHNCTTIVSPLTGTLIRYASVLWRNPGRRSTHPRPALFRTPTPTPISTKVACARRLSFRRCATTLSKNRCRRSLRLGGGDFSRRFSTTRLPVAHPHCPRFSEETSSPGRANHQLRNRLGSPGMSDRDRRILVGARVSATARLFRQSRRQLLGRKASDGKI